MARRVGGVAKPMSDTQFERVLANTARLAIVTMSLVVVIVALRAGQVFLAPVTLAVVTGLMFGQCFSSGTGADCPLFIAARPSPLPRCQGNSKENISYIDTPNAKMSSRWSVGLRRTTSGAM